MRARSGVHNDVAAPLRIPFLQVEELNHEIVQSRLCILIANVTKLIESSARVECSGSRLRHDLADAELIVSNTTHTAKTICFELMFRVDR